jgi:hypothetical protein
MSRRSAVVRWTVLSLLLLVGPALFWASEPAERRLHRPSSPLDLTLEQTAKQWAFLASAAPVVPAGAVVTVDAADSGEEMSLYMLALGILPGHRVVPTTYWGHPVDPPFRADVELAYGCADRSGAGEVIARFPHGCMRRGAP